MRWDNYCTSGLECGPNHRVFLVWYLVEQLEKNLHQVGVGLFNPDCFITTTVLRKQI